MKKPDFLHSLSRDKKLELVEPSPEIASAYLQKGADCLRSAKILCENGLYDNSISLSYYAMYNALTAMLYQTGIKCENHSGSIALLEKLFEQPKLHRLISLAKRERIDKQYYVASASNAASNATLADQTAKEAEEFMLEARLFIAQLDEKRINAIQEKTKRLLA
ncbi:MAG: HEPN domain-containing protein [Candidatus Micrarchaeota archaeon]